MGESRRWSETISRGAHSLSSWISTLRNIGWLLVLLGGLATLVWRSGGLAHPISVRFATPALTLMIAATFIAGWTMASRRHVRAAYDWVSAEYEYRFDKNDPQQHYQTTSITIRANRDGVERFENRYRWSGNGKSEIKILTSDQRLLTEWSSQEADWRYYSVMLDQPLKKGESAMIQIHHELYDSSSTFNPIVTKDVIEPLASLTLKVIYPESLAPISVMARERVRSGIGDPLWRDVDRQPVSTQRSASGVVAQYRPKKITVGRRYELTWVWDDTRKAGK
jgi:hypothetical protein